MSLLRKAWEGRSIPDLPDTYGVPGYGSWGQGMVWTPKQGSSTVSVDEAMRLSAVFACLRLLSEAVATLPLDTFERQEGTRLAFPRPGYLDFEAPMVSRIDYLSQVMLSLLTDGNAFVLTPRDSLGMVLDLIVLNPSVVEVKREHGHVVYSAFDQPLNPDTELMHIKGMCRPGELRGLSPIAYARETIGLGLSAQSFGSRFFENGALPSAVIEVDGNFSDEAARKFRDSWYAAHGGGHNAGKVGVLTGGAKLNQVSVNPDDAQFIEVRQFQVPDVARIFGVPPHLIADASNSTSWGSGLAEQNLAFGQFSLRPWTERIEEAHTRLLSSHGLTDVFVKLNLDALLRASLGSRYESYTRGIRGRFLTINEVRQLEDLPPVPWGDEPAPWGNEPAPTAEGGNTSGGDE